MRGVTVASVARTIGVFFACLAVGFLVAGVGSQLLPDHPKPTQPVLDALEGRPFDTAATSEWLAAYRRPGILLVWVIFPTAALAMGVTAGVLAKQIAPYVAPISVLYSWSALNWGSRVDLRTVQLGALYVAIGSVAAWAARGVRKRMGHRPVPTRAR